MHRYRCLLNVRPQIRMRIVLARHGKPNLRHIRWIAPREMEEWIRLYNHAGVVPDYVPLETVEAASTSGVVVTSTLRRSMQSAQYLLKNQLHLTEQVFCEAELPHPRWHLPRLPASAWVTLFRLAWFFGYSTNAESVRNATARARVAAERLIQLAKENDSVFLVGHGVMTALIAKHLLALGWVGPARPAHNYWQFSIYHAA